MSSATLAIGDLTAVIGDNDAGGAHRAGYNGLWSLDHRGSRAGRSLFVPAYAGWNLEHIISGDGEADRNVFFEPRTSPMTLRRTGDAGCELHQPPTHTHFLESWTRFTLVPPHFIDIEFTCMPTQHAFRRGYCALFWASYIQAPQDKSLYFLGRREQDDGPALWQQLCTPAHNHASTVRHRDDQFVMTFAEGAPDALYKNFSPLRFDLPLFYGLFEDLVWIVMFDRSDGIRLVHSPSGGGADATRRTTNPAWDFQWIIPRYEVLEKYTLRARTSLRPACSRDAMIEEYTAWAATVAD